MTMSAERIGDALDRAEEAVAKGGGLRGTGFWKAVSAVRADPGLAASFGERIGAIDRRAFERGVRLRVPVWAGNGLLAGGTTGAALAIALAPRLERLPRTIVFLTAVGALVVTTHSLAHYLVGRAVGMRFTHYFLGGPPPPRPGVKTDYASYLATPPRQRAAMHASGAVVTKLVPFAAMPAGALVGVAGWAYAALAVLGVAQIVTDVALSTKSSDWKKVKRELRAARTSS